jgi:branched-chain amino acid transport system permease protein
MMIWLNQIIQGVLLGGYYALIASGLSFMFSVMRIINLAHGSLAVLAAYMLFVLADRFGISPFLGLLIVMPVMAAIGWALQRAVLERSLRGGMLVPILSTFGLSIVIDNLLFQQFGADTRSLAPYIGDLSYNSWEITDDIDIGQLAVLTLAAAVLLLGGLQLFLTRTQLGRAIRATAEDPDTVGGAGSLWGTLAGGIVLGVAQSIGAQIDPQGFLITGHLVFLLVLFARLAPGRFAFRLPRVRSQQA